MLSINPSDWIIRFNPNPTAKIQLYCFPFAGGSANNYRTCSNVFPTEIEVCAIELPGRGRRMQEPLFKSLSSLIDEMGTALEIDSDRPFAFFGHSMGALLGFELTRYMRYHNRALPRLLAVSGRRPPQCLPNSPIFHQLPEPQFWTEINALGGTPKILLENKELRSLFFPIIQADFTLIETYIYADEEPLDCSIVAYTGNRDSEVSVEQLEQWKLQTHGEFWMKAFPGEHFYINSCVKDIALDLAPKLLDSSTI